jgi:hypothetical protein
MENLIELYKSRIKHKELYLKQHKPLLSDWEYIEKITEIAVYKSVIKDLKKIAK